MNTNLIIQKRIAIETIKAAMDVLLELPDDVSNDEIIAIVAHGYVTLKTGMDLIGAVGMEK